MSVYRPTYRDQKTGEQKQSRIWWYHFVFEGHHFQESSKSHRKTVALEAEKIRRRELETTFNAIEDNRHERIRSITELADAYLKDYEARHQTSLTFATYALRHVKRLLGNAMKGDISDKTVKDYQTARLKEKAAPKSINEEVGFLLRLLDEQGDFFARRCGGCGR